MGRYILALLVVSLETAPLAAQDPAAIPSVDSGSIVRLSWRDGAPRVGRLLNPLGPESMTVVYCRYPGPPCEGASAPAAEVRPTSTLLRIEKRSGSRAGRGALIGAGVGVLVIGLGRLALADEDSPAPPTGQRIAGAITVVGLSAGVGALIGNQVVRWEIVR